RELFNQRSRNSCLVSAGLGGRATTFRHPQRKLAARRGPRTTPLSVTHGPPSAAEIFGGSEKSLSSPARCCRLHSFRNICRRLGFQQFGGSHGNNTAHW